MGQGFHGASTFRLNILLGEGGLSYVFNIFSSGKLLQSINSMGCLQFSLSLLEVRRGARLAFF